MSDESAAEASRFGRSVRSGAVFTIAAQVVVLCSTFGGTFVLANLLSPSAFGLIGIVAAATGAGDLLRDAGLSNAAIQARKLTDRQRSNLFWVSSGLGLLVGAVVALIAPFLGELFGDESLVPITQVIALTFLLNGLTAQHRASLSRGLRLKTVAMIDASASIASTVTAIVVAALTHSVWSLVCQQLAGPLVALVASFAIARWVPGIPRRNQGTRAMLGYGAHQLGAQLAIYAGENVDTLVAGYRFSSTDVGFYSRAYSLVTRPLTQINVPSSKLAVPVLSRLQDDDERFHSYLERAHRMVLLCSASVLMLFASIVGPLILLLMGGNWLPIVPLIQVLAIGALFRVGAFSLSWFAAARGLNRISLYSNLTALPVTILAVIVGSNWGILGIAIAQAFSGAVIWALGLVWFKMVAAAPSGRLASLSLTTMAALALPFVAGLLTSQLLDVHPLLRASLGAVAFCAVLGGEALCIRTLRRDFGSVLGLMLRRRH